GWAVENLADQQCRPLACRRLPGHDADRHTNQRSAELLIGPVDSARSWRTRERAQRSEPGERPAFARSASARSRRSLGGGGSEPAKRLAREPVGESEGRSP